MDYKIGGEEYSVQSPIIDYVKEDSEEYITSDGKKIFLNLGWNYVSPDEALRLRGGETGILFKEIFKNKIYELNKDFITDEIIEDLIKKFEKVYPNINGNFEIFKYLKGLKTCYVPKEKIERNVKFIDTEKIENNIFQVTDEFEFTNGTNTIREDIVFLINGIPLIFVETKAPHKIEGISEALEQVKRYHRDCPELLSIQQIYVLTDIIKFFYSATSNLSFKTLFNWKIENFETFESCVKTFFDKENVIKLVTDYILFTKQDDELKKVVLRPHQIRAIKKLIERASDKFFEKTSLKQRGLIWHTQGSGKTYTMIVFAQKLMENPIFENPTVLMIVDRNELESQLFSNISSVGIGNIVVAGSKEHLKNLLKEDRRGLITTLIQKFEGIEENINLRKNIFVLVDEAHRTTGGKLGNYLMGALPNATYIGFTGTPIDKTSYGNNTFITFGKDDPPKGYLDKYSIVESIEDNTTVPLHYSLAPNELRVDRETLDREFLNLVELEGVSDIEDLNKVLDKAVNLKNMLKKSERIDKIAKYVSEHYKEFIEPLGYKAFLVTVDREACALYKEALNKYLPDEYSKVVFSPFYNDEPLLRKYHLSENEEKIIRKNFRDPEKLPKILIVTEKLLTGFDAPILYCMYLDKPMRDHVLLQAIARVNRPYEDMNGRKKSCGLIIDFVGIFENLEKALAFDSKDIEGVVKDIEVLKERFKELIEIGRKNYISLIEDKNRDKAIEFIFQYFIDQDKRNEYYKFFKEILSIYEIISPDSFLRPYIVDMETLTRIYKILKENYEGTKSVDPEFSKKVKELVQKHTESGVIKPILEVYELDENILKKIEESKASDTEKVFNLKRTIENFINKNPTPFLISIGEKVEAIIKEYMNRQKTTQETLEELKKYIQEINNSKKEQIEKNMDDTLFSIYWILKDEKFENPEEVSKEIYKIFKNYPFWIKSKNQSIELKKCLLAYLVKSNFDVERSSDFIEKILKYLRWAKRQ
jgi:type I restriction enzyme R subunit